MTVEDTPLVSIITPVFNGEKYFEDAIKSILNQTYQNFELLIINDGSTDNSKVIIERYLSDTRVKYFEQKNAGVANARNHGLTQAQGEFIGFLDQDDMWLSHKLASQVNYLQKNKEFVLVHAYQEYIDANNNIFIYQNNWITNIQGDCFESLFMKNQIGILTVLLRRELLDAFNTRLFNESLPGTDDYELWLKISINYQIGFINRAVAQYRKHNDNISNNILKMRLLELRTLEKTISSNTVPITNSKIKTRLFNLNLKISKNYIWPLLKYKLAKTFLVKAIILNPFHLESYRLLLWCLLPPSARSLLPWYYKKIITLLKKPT